MTVDSAAIEDTAAERTTIDGMAIDVATIDVATIDGTAGDGTAEMVRLDAQLAARPVRETVGLTMPAAHLDAVDVVAVRHGYRVHVRHLDPGDTGEVGLAWVELRPR